MMENAERKSAGRSALRVIKALLFIGLGVCLFLLIQRLLLSKWNYPVMGENVTYSLESFYRQEKGVDDVLFLGTSHMEFGLSPIELYQEYGISSYNLAISAERISGSYFLLREALKTQQPQVVVLDVSNLFLADTNEGTWRYVIDTMPRLTDKLPIAASYVEFQDALRRSQSVTDDEAGEEAEEETEQARAGTARLTAFTDILGPLANEDYRSALLPIIRYHTRWNGLVKTDFRDFLPEDGYYTAGYYMNPVFWSSGQTVAYMNKVADKMAKLENKKVVTFTDGQAVHEKTQEALYQPSISPENEAWLEKIRQLCEQNDVKLLLTKIPSIHLPNQYASAWTRVRADYMKEYAREKGYEFYDLLYDVDLQIDINTDSSDGGDHLNYRGARKVTKELGRYLQEEYHITARYNARFDENLTLYQEMAELADMELEQDLPTYLDMLGEKKERYLICLAAQDDMKQGLSDEDIEALHRLGLAASFRKNPGYRWSYLAVLDSGVKTYEAAANRKLTYEMEFGGETMLSMTSAGWYVGASASIKFDETEYAVNSTGLNIVVYDKETGLVIDSAVFNTDQETPHSCRHKEAQLRLGDYWMAKLGRL